MDRYNRADREELVYLQAYATAFVHFSMRSGGANLTREAAADRAEKLAFEAVEHMPTNLEIMRSRRK